ncbi:hypothetical protein E2C01_089733 [Portunus trituberculatus]|uniref:Uncharacterized protein n=1 Tax=Portunus trituberculatus TaxID=210409 RepID=A0A5B7JIA1_PORTR|nr:hypothetical protein [Portunus trituberculatus]
MLSMLRPKSTLRGHRQSLEQVIGLLSAALLCSPSPLHSPRDSGDQRVLLRIHEAPFAWRPR